LTAIDAATEAVRAYLTEDFSTHQQLNAQLGKEERAAYAIVLAAAFRSAATSRFGEQYSIGDIIEFVAETRAQYARVADAVSAEDAENAIRAALGEEHLIDAMSGYAYGSAQAAMLFALTHENATARAGIGTLLDSAAEQAEGYLQRRNQPS
jgi:hypothetical protein